MVQQQHWPAQLKLRADSSHRQRSSERCSPRPADGVELWPGCLWWSWQSQCPCVCRPEMCPVICTCTHTHVHIPMYTCTHTHVHMYTYPCAHVHIPTHVHIPMYTCTHTHVHIPMYPCTHTHVHMHTYPCTHAHMHTYCLYTYPCTHTPHNIDAYTRCLNGTWTESADMTSPFSRLARWMERSVFPTAVVPAIINTVRACVTRVTCERHAVHPRATFGLCCHSLHCHLHNLDTGLYFNNYVLLFHTRVFTD